MPAAKDNNDATLTTATPLTSTANTILPGIPLNTPTTEKVEEQTASTNIKDAEAGKLAPIKEKPKIKPIDVAGKWAEISNAMIDDITQDGRKEFGRLFENVAKRYMSETSPADLDAHAKYYKDKPVQLFVKEQLLERLSPEVRAQYKDVIKEGMQTLKQTEKWDNDYTKFHNNPTDNKNISLNAFSQLSLATQNVIIERDITQKEMDTYKNASTAVRESALKNQKLSPQAFQGLKNIDAEKQALADAQATLQKIKDNPVKANASEKEKENAAQALENAIDAVSTAEQKVKNSADKLKTGAERYDINNPVNTAPTAPTQAIPGQPPQARPQPQNAQPIPTIEAHEIEPPELTPTSPSISAINTGIPVGANTLSTGSQQIAQNEVLADQLRDQLKTTAVTREANDETLEQKIATRQERGEERVATKESEEKVAAGLLAAHGSMVLDSAVSPTNGALPIEKRPTSTPVPEPRPEPSSTPTFHPMGGKI